MRTINLIQNLSNISQLLQNKIANIDNEMLTDSQYLELAASLSDSYDSNATYTMYEFCIYNYSVYVANTSILIPEAFNSNHWDLIGTLD